MGAGASAVDGTIEEEGKSIFDVDAFLEEEVALPVDGGDLEGRDPGEFKVELSKLRKFCQRTQSAREVDKRNRLDILAQKMDHQSFRGGSLNYMLKQASTVR